MSKAVIVDVVVGVICFLLAFVVGALIWASWSRKAYHVPQRRAAPRSLPPYVVPPLPGPVPVASRCCPLSPEVAHG